MSVALTRGAARTASTGALSPGLSFAEHAHLVTARMRIRDLETELAIHRRATELLRGMPVQTSIRGHPSDGHGRPSISRTLGPETVIHSDQGPRWVPSVVASMPSSNPSGAACKPNSWTGSADAIASSWSMRSSSTRRSVTIGSADARRSGCSHLSSSKLGTSPGWQHESSSATPRNPGAGQSLRRTRGGSVGLLPMVAAPLRDESATMRAVMPSHGSSKESRFQKSRR